MALQILLNFLLAFLWAAMNDTFELPTLIMGYIMGMITIYIIRNFLPGSFYLVRFYRIIKLIVVFIKELIIANITVTKIVLKPKINVHPGFYAYPCDLEEDWEVVLLSSLITLTPGTVVVAISDDYSKLYIHGVDLTDADDEIASIKSSFENVIKEVGQP
ncbi:Na+/H+ antiporter subunit E [Phocicoccus pinnipedialis]|uniref:Na(+)/H(+) antiporter subunit E1 n=1 Tax=Phocicoccus pinnipedialis TaxID=110845 RepID=A0A6V7R7K1_9BACL|nr:Na+/H+ antiporter subunit E [Jeotgalicoccus pinnipedialis]MBP1938884.1 multicomponent Na+:H+ antiporter subunit E [Jeotgalicoccus pinnipedialis]CAD2073276.1 Na(+)/H(+) antiporter subunit E1 [Jeotgalicoccus pinnipedialis]